MFVAMLVASLPCLVYAQFVHVIEGGDIQIGFTDTAGNVLDLWFNEHIPSIINVAQNLSNSELDARVQFTTSSYLIAAYLSCPLFSPFTRIECPDDTAIAATIEAINSEIITWHGFP